MGISLSKAIVSKIPAFPLAEYRSNVRIHPHVEPLALVTPLHVFAAHRESFDAIVRQNWQKPRAIDAIFDALPLAEHGWNRATVKATHIGNSERRYPIWRLERG